MSPSAPFTLSGATSEAVELVIPGQKVVGSHLRAIVDLSVPIHFTSHVSISSLVLVFSELWRV